MISAKKIVTCFFCLILMSSFCFHALAQLTNTPLLPDEYKNESILMFNPKREDVGSRFLTTCWVAGAVETTGHRILPETPNSLLFNYDKIDNYVYTINNQKKITRFPVDSIAGFDLLNDGKTWSFEKVSWISTQFFLIPVIKSSKGYSLYKRLFTKYIRSDYSSEGYYSVGKNYDEYVDYFEYFVIYPGNTSFRKIYMKEKDLRRALKDESKLMDDFFSLHDKEITEQSMLGIIQFINDKKYPD